ncbi:MAG: hypothetical protein KL839_01455 [Rhizobium sp.]|nr:hypothetical protein [Rhizobium sp.]
MVSAISRILSFDRPFSLAWIWPFRLFRRRRRLTRIQDLPDDLLRDIGLPYQRRPSGPHAHDERHILVTGDQLRPGPM